ncbi:retina-specific copper amine oxidase [Ictalurus punctatus]|uniref:Amine oxidase n=1 Tax=Ictalurus punctatus TaxID=7998 RepID=A0A2D0SN35_ICTPU|nr:retina-specific copper amine oxidase [Ictalurus punctatus]
MGMVWVWLYSHAFNQTPQCSLAHISAPPTKPHRAPALRFLRGMVSQVTNSLLKCLLILICLVSVILNIVLICLNSNRLPKCHTHSQGTVAADHTDHSLIFADLTPKEYQMVRDYMWDQKDLRISHSATAKVSENYIFLIDLVLPKKAEALRYLDNQGLKPERQASVVVFYGEFNYLKEYVVGPLPGPLKHRDVTMEKYKVESLPFTARPVTIGEYVQLIDLVYGNVFMQLKTELKESFGYDPKSPNLSIFEGMPRGVKAGDRKTWISFFRDFSGMYIHPVGFEILVRHESKNSSDWMVEKLLYNGQYFDTIESFKQTYAAGGMQKIVYKEVSNFASLKPRSVPTGLGPHQYYLQGKRFSVKSNQVIYKDWRFAFGLSSLTGMRVFDVRFRGDRIIYELSVQEAMSVYGSITPGMMLTKFLDTSIGIGRFAHELVRGVDCPYSATYIDVYRYIDINATQLYSNAICVFEHDVGRPLRRHFSDFFQNSYGGLTNSALYIRSITAIGNYDYIWDFIFYQSGTVEARVHATGYISSSYKVPGSLKYGHQVAENVLGNIHTHFANFKVDLDILGVRNVFQTKDMEYEEVSLPWMTERKAKIPKLVENQLKTEQEAALRHNSKIPRYLHVASNQTNRWGHQRSYKLQVMSLAGDHLPESEPEERSMSWARYKVAITKHKDSEQTCSSLYSQNNIWDPVVDFSNYIKDNEHIENEDLVAWVTAGFLHIPHAEDIPNTVTVGNGGAVLIRPHNYFDEDPSIDSVDGVYFNPGSETDCEYNKMACLDKHMCSPTLEPYTYRGFEGVIKFDK